MKVFENLKYSFERATYGQQVAVATLIIFVVSAPMLLSLGKSLKPAEAPAPKSIVVVVPVLVAVQKPGAVQTDKAPPAAAPATTTSAASFNKK